MNKKIVSIQKISLFTSIIFLSTIFFSGCGDLESEMVEKRTISFDMDYAPNSMTKKSSNISASKASEYNSHLIIAIPSWESINSNYTNF